MDDESQRPGDFSRLEQALQEALPLIDRDLASAGVKIPQRPTHAAMEFVETFVLAVREADGTQSEPVGFASYADSKWFAAIYASVLKWYRARFGAACEGEGDIRLRGVISINETTFAVHVPRFRTRKSQTPNRVWFGIPDNIGDNEDPMSWVKLAPDLNHLSDAESQKAQSDARSVSERLRFINSAITGISDSSEALRGFLTGILPRLAHAADMLTTGTNDTLQQAFWELQLACENALKSVQQQRTNSFKSTHDLFALYDGISPAPKLSRELLKKLPRWEEAAELRYGQGNHKTRSEAMSAYNAALSIVVGAMDSLERAKVGKAEFELQRPPWMTAF